jgi:DNA mismatch repair protein MutS2
MLKCLQTEVKKGNVMNKKSLDCLEYNKIVDMLSSYTTGESVKRYAQKIRPYNDFYKVSEALEETDQAVKLIMKCLSPPSCGLNGQEEIIKRSANGGILEIRELLLVSSFLGVCRRYHEYCEDIENYSIINEYVSALLPFTDIENEIERCILNDEELKDNASAKLSSIRRETRVLNDKIKSTLNSYISSGKYQKYLQDQIVTTRNGRYVIAVKAEYKSEINGIVHDTSSTGATLFIEPASVVEADNKLRELEIEEQKEIFEILKGLSGLIGENKDSLLVNAKYLLKLDFAFAKAKLAINMDGIMPVLNKEFFLDFKKARHPLIDKSKVVPIDVNLGKDFSTLIITGPNTGGKTVTLKTLGLLSLMVQSGLHIPVASGSSACVFGDIFADIGDEQSIEQNLSTFSAHMTNIVSIFKNVKENSLVLFDELGAGTDPIEGAALAMAILEKLKSRDILTVSTTHYSELKLYALTTKGVSNASCEFDVETLRPTYKLIIGMPGKSNAFAISKKLGLSDSIISKAETFISSDSIKFEDALEEVEINRRRAQSDKDKARIHEEKAYIAKVEVEKEKQNLEKVREEIIAKANEDARRIIEDATKEADDAVNEINKLRMQSGEKEAVKALEELRKELHNKGKRRRKKADISLQNSTEDAPVNLIAGSYVYITDTDTVGTVVSPPDKKGNVVVQSGILKMEVHISHLKNAEKNETEKTLRNYTSSRSFNKTGTISPELDLRGLYTEEAVDKTDRFIHDAAISSLSQVRVVHGKGTGALKSAIHSMLKTHRYVKSFRLGNYGEGDSGVTVVELK